MRGAGCVRDNRGLPGAPHCSVLLVRGLWQVHRRQTMLLLEKNEGMRAGWSRTATD